MKKKIEIYEWILDALDMNTSMCINEYLISYVWILVWQDINTCATDNSKVCHHGSHLKDKIV